jgi:hypothetical protein
VKHCNPDQVSAHHERLELLWKQSVTAQLASTVNKGGEMLILVVVFVGMLGQAVIRRGVTGRALLVGAIFLLACSLRLSAGADAAYPANPLQATNSREARENALRSIPYDRLDQDARAKVDAVLSNISVYRRLPVRVTDCDPNLYIFLVRHPDVVVNIWELLGVSQVHARQVLDGRFRVSDNSGTTGTLEILYQSQDTHLVYAQGQYEGVLCPRPAHGSCLLVFKSGYVRESDGRWYVTTRLDAFLNLEPGALELLTKTLQTLVGPVADANFTQTIGFVGSLSHTSEVNPQGVRRLAGKLTHVPPEVRLQFAEIAERVSKQVIDYPPRAGAPAGPAVLARRTEQTDAR